MAELLEELIVRLKLTNGLDFCAPARVDYAINLLQGTNVPEPQERTIIEHPSLADILRERLKPTPDHDDVANDDLGPYKPPEHIANARLMYIQLMRLAKKEGRW